MTSKLTDWLGCHGDALYSTLVRPAPDAEEAVFAPSRSPAVLHDPVFLTRLLAPPIAHQEHRMIGQLERVDGVKQARVMVDAPFIEHEVRINLKGHAQRAVPHQLGHHDHLVAPAVEATYVVVLGDVIARTVSRDGAGRIFASVREALLLDNAEVLHIFPDQVRETAITT